jgi:hypothetical protein
MISIILILLYSHVLYLLEQDGSGILIIPDFIITVQAIPIAYAITGDKDRGVYSFPDASLGNEYKNSKGDITLWVEPDATANNDYSNINIDDGTYIYRFYSGGKLFSISYKSTNANTCQI